MLHTKLRRLCRKLNVPLYVGVGLLECLWHLTAREAPRGDIGRLSNEDIAIALEWTEDEETLVEAFISCGWIDHHADYRLVVHDWHEHCDEAVKKLVARSGGFAVNPTPTIEPSVYFVQGVETKRIKIGFTEGSIDFRIKALQCGSAERLELLASYHAPRAEEGRLHKRFADAAISGEWFEPTVELSAFIGSLRQTKSANGGQRQTLSEFGSLPEPSLSQSQKPKPEKQESGGNPPAGGSANSPPPRSSKLPRDWEQRWKEFLEVYPPRLGDRNVGPGKATYQKLLARGVDPDLILAGVRRYRALSDVTGDSGTQFVAQITSWLRAERWGEQYDIPDRPPPQRNGRGAAPDTPPLEDRHQDLLTRYTAAYGTKTDDH
jgi:hypothetical protein